MPRARTSACCMRRRWCSRRSWRGRSWSDVPRWSRRGSSASASPIKAGQDFDLINPEDDPRYRSYVQSYIDVAGRHGVTPDAARTRGAHQRHRDRGAGGDARRSRRHDLRRRRPLHEPSAPCARDHRLSAGGHRLRGAGADDHQQGRLFHRRHPGAAAAERRGTGGNGGAGRDPCPALQYQAQGRLRVTFRLRQL